MARLPFDLRPMKAISGVLPTNDDEWAFEIKWDGMRLLAFVDGGLRLKTTNDIEVASRFPELESLVDHLAGHRAVLDGEIVAMTPDGGSDFGRLQPRMHLADPAEARRRAAAEPLSFVVFDLLHLDDTSTLSLPYEQRRQLLLGLVDPSPGRLVPTHTVGHGRELLDAAAARGLEGLIAKRLGSRYEPGRRSQSWRKLKVRREQEVVVGGWTPGTGNREDHFGSLLVGVHDPGDPDGPLRFAGGVGTGFKVADLDHLLATLGQLATDDCPFDPPPPPLARRGAHWVRPELVAEVAFGEWTSDDRLRHPSFLGLRIDKPPGEVVREP